MRHISYIPSLQLFTYVADIALDRVQPQTLRIACQAAGDSTGHTVATATGRRIQVNPSRYGNKYVRFYEGSHSSKSKSVQAIVNSTLGLQRLHLQIDRTVIRVSLSHLIRLLNRSDLRSEDKVLGDDWTETQGPLPAGQRRAGKAHKEGLGTVRDQS